MSEENKGENGRCAKSAPESGYVATYESPEWYATIAVLACGSDKGLVKELGFKIAKERELTNYFDDIRVIKVQAT